MKLVKPLLLIVTILFVCNIITAQISLNLSREIKWNKIKSFNIGEYADDKDEIKFVLDFDEAIYPDLTFLPFYSENIPININFDGNSGFDISFADIKYSNIEDENVNKVDNLNNVTAPNIEYNVFYSEKIPYLCIKFLPLRKNTTTGKIEKVISFELNIKEISGSKINNFKYYKATESSVLSTGKWYKIQIQEDGVYKLTYNQLKSMGFENPSNVRVFGNDAGMLPFMNNQARPDDLIENKIFKGSDYILFYAKGPTSINLNSTSNLFEHKLHSYSRSAYYFLTDLNTGFDNSIEIRESSNQAPNSFATTFTDYKFHEIDSVNIMKSGRQWLGDFFSYRTSYDYNFDFPNIVSGSNINIEIVAYARSTVSSSFTFTYKDFIETTFVKKIDCSGVTCSYAYPLSKYYSVAAQQDIVNLNLTFNKAVPSAEAWLDYIRINAKRQLVMHGSQMHFSNLETIGKDNVTKFTLKNVNSETRVWDISNPTKPIAINYNLNGNELNYTLETPELRNFIAFDQKDFKVPIFSNSETGIIQNQNLHSLKNLNMIIITHPDFLTQATELAEFHRTHDNLITEVVTTKQIYNEFSSGITDASAIRDFVRMVYKRSDKFRYLLLIGDGSIDNITKSKNNTAFIPTYQAWNSFNIGGLTLVTDDYFGLLDDNEGEITGLIDIGIGRFPVKNTSEAQNAVNKVKNYYDEKSKGDWRNVICFIADDEDSNMHMGSAEELSQIVNNKYPFLNIEKIYLDAYKQYTTSVGESYPEVNIAFTNRVLRGALIVNYVGHGGEKGLAHEGILSIREINRWNNKDKLPLFITATCEFSRFDDYDRDKDQNFTSAGEWVFLNPIGGAIALFTTTRVVYAHNNASLNNHTIRNLFNNNSDGTRYRIGDIVRKAKIAQNDYNMLNYTILGDPAILLPLPELNVKTILVNDTPIENFTDTLKALSKVKVSGIVTRKTGELVEDYNGVVYTSLFDKKRLINTQNNNNTGVFTFFSQDNTLFKGTSTVRNGKFDVTFIIPKDIYYNIDMGKLSYYAYNKDFEAKGYNTDLKVGGILDKQISDNIGPQIELYLNDENFIDGGITNQNPDIYIILSDSSGINTSKSGIGHDIVATLDKNANQIYVLNDFYETELDNFQKGKIKFSLSKLKNGEHNLHLRAWDVYNNSSDEFVNFIVADSKDFTINHLFNYPNPFTTNTSFFFEHNQAGTTLDIQIQIFSVSGKLVKTIESQQLVTGFRTNPIPWDGLDDYGDKIGKGVYFYKLKVKTQNGKTVEKFEKLLILR